MTQLRFLVADSLTGKLIGRLAPSEWEWVDPLTGTSKGTFTVALPRTVETVAQLQDLTTPHTRQVVAVDEKHRVWFGGPITADPERQGDNIVVTTADWRAWFYAAAIRPLDNSTRQDYIHVDTPVEQNQAVADLAGIALNTVGAPHLVVDAPVDSGITRQVNEAMFTMTGDAIDHVAQADGGPDWWVYLDYDNGDLTTVVGHVAVGYPERSAATSPLLFRTKAGVSLRSKLGQGGNLISVTWPRGNVPPSRVFGVGSTPPPGEEWATAEDPDLTDGLRLAWDEVYQLPDGVNTPDASYAAAVSRLDANSQALGAIEVSLVVDATDLYTWGAGDRTRVVIDDGWRNVDLDERRILSRTLRGRAGHITECLASVNLSSADKDISDPTEIPDSSA